MPQIISLTVSKRNDTVKTPVATGFDVEDIVEPIKFLSGKGVSVIEAREMKGEIRSSRINGKVRYEVSEGLDAIKAMSTLLVKLTVLKKSGNVVDNEEMLFVTSRISESINPENGGSKFFYVEDGESRNVEYEVLETVAQIVAQNPPVVIPPGALPLFIVDITWPALKILKDAGTMSKGTFYKITDRFNYQSGGTGTIPNQSFLGDDRGFVYLQALEVDELSTEAFRVMATPSDYNTELDGSGNSWNGVWNINTTGVGLDELVIRGARVFKNLGNDLTGTADNENTLDAADWLLISKGAYANDEYVDKKFSVIYDFDNDWFEKQYDGNGNIVGLSFLDVASWIGLVFNPCDVTDWNMVAGYTAGSVSFMNNDVPLGVYNNTSSIIYDNKITSDNAIEDNTSSDIYGNRCKGIFNNTNAGSINLNDCNGSISGNSNDGQISRNINLGVSNNSNAGNIISNKNDGDIQLNSNDGNITGNSNKGRITSNTNGSSIEFNSNGGDIDSNANTDIIDYNTQNPYFQDISGLTASQTNMTVNSLKNNTNVSYDVAIDPGVTINLGSFGLKGYIDKVKLTSADATETITTITYANMPPTRKVIFEPESGLEVTFTPASNLLLEGGINAVIDGTTQDFIEFQKGLSGKVKMTNGANY